MDLRRVLRPRQSAGEYDLAIRDVLGAPGRRETDAIALLWAHQIAWAAHTDERLDEVNLLSLAAERYGVPLATVLDERTRRQASPPVVPAARPQKPAPAPAVAAAPPPSPAADAPPASRLKLQRPA